MDYLQQVDGFLGCLQSWWKNAREGDRLSGAPIDQVAACLGVSEDVVRNIILSLDSLNVVENNPYGRVSIMPNGRGTVSKGLHSLWLTFMKPNLADDEQLLLRTVVAMGLIDRGGHINIVDVRAKDLVEAVGKDWGTFDSVGETGGAWAHSNRTRLAEEGFIRVGPDWETYNQYNRFEVTPTYKGIVRVQRTTDLMWGSEVQERLPTWETTITEFKGDLPLGTPKQNAEFTRDILALANTQSGNQPRILVAGFSNKTHEFEQPQNLPLDKDQLERILHSWSEPTPEIHYHRVHYDGGDVGIVEVLRDAAKLPYRIHNTQDRWKIKENGIYVRHGSQVEQATPNEEQSLHDEAKRTPNQS